VLLGKVDAAIPQDRVGDQAGSLLSRGGAAFEELVAKRAIGAEPLARRAGKDTGPAAGRTGLLALVGAGGRQLHHGGHLHRIRDRLHDDQGIALRGLDDGWRWRLQRWCCCGSDLGLDGLPE